MFSPKPNVPYKLVFQEIQNNTALESDMIITFTEENNIYPLERCFGFTPYEGYDKFNYRFICYVCYMDDSVVLNSCDALKVLLDSEAYGNDNKINSFQISKIYLEDDILVYPSML